MGTVHVAVAGPGDGEVEHRRLRLPGDRERVRRFSTQIVLEMLRRRLLAVAGRRDEAVRRPSKSPSRPCREVRRRDRRRARPPAAGPLGGPRQPPPHSPVPGRDRRGGRPRRSPAGSAQAFARCPPLDLRLVERRHLPAGPPRPRGLGRRRGPGRPARPCRRRSPWRRSRPSASSPRSGPITRTSPWPAARTPGGGEAIDKLKTALTGPVGPPFVADHGILFESKLSPKGARYRIIEAFPMEGEEQP